MARNKKGKQILFSILNLLYASLVCKIFLAKSTKGAKKLFLASQFQILYLPNTKSGSTMSSSECVEFT